MDDLADSLQALLRSPGMAEKLQGVLSSLTQGTSPPPGGTVPTAPPPPAAPPSGLDPAMLTRLLPLLGGLQQETEDTALLRALRPYLHGEREKRLDGAIQMMRLASLLPLLQGGLLSKGGL